MKKESIQIEYLKFSALTELSDEDKDLVLAALDASKRAYAPYSKFNVGAAVRLSNNKIIKGSNQENQASPSGLCAERVTLFYAGSEYPNEKIEAMAITTCSNSPDDLEPVTPCGACRQVMQETLLRQNSPFKIILAHQNGSGIILNDINSLLPFSFTLTK